ncbi:MAG: phosphatase PAP2 family protein [Phycisphaerales bacterium]|nr:phosphatase PAP2 family protein [Phycisphaerales bacterium]
MAIFDKELALYGAGLSWTIADASHVLTEFGEGQWVVIPAVVLFLWGWRSGRDNLARWAFLLGVSVGSSGAIANLLKVVFARWRPMAFIEGDQFGFEWFATGSVRASFPSGHATTAGAAALVLALWFPSWRWPILLLGIAIAATRVILGMHYPTDVIAGWTIGGLCVTFALWIWWRASPSTVPIAMGTGLPRTPVAIAWTAIILGTLMRVLAGVWLPLGIDEAYEVATCKSVVLSGFDHPPMVYWLARLGLFINGTGPVEAIWIRLPFIALFALTSWFAWRLASLVFSQSAGAWAVVVLNLSALFSLAHGGWALPDGPLMAAVLAMALVLARGGVVGPLQGTTLPWGPWTTWLCAGFALGIAALSKYQAAIVGVSVFAFLLSTPTGRRTLAHPPAWVGAAIAVCLAMPVVIWNADNGWTSLRFQGARAASEGGFHPLSMLGLLAAQAGIILPWIWAPLLFEWVKALRVGRANQATWFFASMGGIPIVLFLVISAWSPKGLPHWSAVGYLFLFPLLGVATAHELAKGRRALVRNWLVFSTVMLVTIVPIGVSQAASGWLTRAVPLSSAAKDATLEALPWGSVRTYIERRIATRIALNAVFLVPSGPKPQFTDATIADPCVEDLPSVEPAPITEAYTPPTASPSTWIRTPPKVTRTPREIEVDPPIHPLDVDVLSRCGDEGLAVGRFFLAGVSWRDAGKLAVAVEGLGIPVACLSEDPRQFKWMTDPQSLQGFDALVFASAADAAAAERALAGQFRSIAPIAVIRLNRGTSIAQQITVLCAIDFEPPREDDAR